MIYYWIQEATQAGAQEAASSLPSAILSGGVVGAVVALVGLIFAQHRHTQTLRQNRELEAQRAHEAALQKYFEQVGKLLIEESLRNATPGDNLSTIARAQTLAVLEGLDPDRKRILLQFLYESNLIEADKPVISLVGANLQGANLPETNLQDAYLQEANLQWAYLRLARANLQRAYLQGANLQWANLQDADLQGAILQGADLQEAILQGAYLQEANLEEADLRKATGLTQKRLETAIGDENTKLPGHLQRPAHWSKRGVEEPPKQS